LLGILDAIKDIKNIADTSTAQALKILMAKIIQLDKKELESLLQYALQYPPRVRALLGAIVEYQFKNKYDTAALQKTLNPTTIFKLGVKETDLPTMKNWKLK
jgi:hypothetical protein